MLNLHRYENSYGKARNEERDGKILRGPYGNSNNSVAVAGIVAYNSTLRPIGHK